MNITIEEDPQYSIVEVHIRCANNNHYVHAMVAKLRMLDRRVTGLFDNTTCLIDAEDILYIEAIDRKTFFYTADMVFETTLRLYEFEEDPATSDFLRISKSMVVNFDKITSLRPEIHGRLRATLNNNEVVIISRQYVPAVKRKLGL